MTMARHTDEEIERASAWFDRLADGLDPQEAAVSSTEDLRRVAAASEAVRVDEVRLRQAVEVARGTGRSWNQIGVALGVSRPEGAGPPGWCAARRKGADGQHLQKDLIVDHLG
jgi:hypothetical protein